MTIYSPIPVIALDGHAGAGKSTVAGQLARKLGFWHVNTGLFYRALTWKVLEQQLDPRQQSLIEALAFQVRIRVEEDAAGTQHVWLNQDEITALMRTPEINRHISLFSSYPGVREAITGQLRQIYHPRGIIMDGRDIGTVVFPTAPLKVFLTASVEERAQRQYRDARAQGQAISLEELKQAIIKRDQMDSEREVAPLKQAPDAVCLDSTGMTIDAVVQQILELWAVVSPEKQAEPA